MGLGVGEDGIRDILHGQLAQRPDDEERVVLVHVDKRAADLRLRFSRPCQ